MWTILRVLALQALVAAAVPRGRSAKSLDYCTLCEPPGTKHTMCLYPPGPGANCSGYKMAPLSDAEKRTIVRTHNVVRSRVANGHAWAKTTSFGPQPQAANMHQLFWDEELAAIAQRWADQCLSFYTNTPHDDCRDTFRFPVGQNIVTTAFSKPVASNVRARCLDWYGELLYFDPKWVEKFATNPDPDPLKQIGHYTQMVWGWSYAIGCARVVFTEQFKSEQRPWTIERLVCNYAPSGNYLGEALYAVGPPCSQCPNGTVCSKRYPGLCALTSQVEREEGMAGKPTKTSAAADKPASRPLERMSVLPDFFNIAAFLPASWLSKSPVEPVAANRERVAEEAVILAEARSIENGTRKTENFKLSYEEPGEQESQGSGILEEVLIPDDSEDESVARPDSVEEASVVDSNVARETSALPDSSASLTSEYESEFVPRGLLFYERDSF